MPKAFQQMRLRMQEEVALARALGLMLKQDVGADRMLLSLLKKRLDKRERSREMLRSRERSLWAMRAAGPPSTN